MTIRVVSIISRMNVGGPAVLLTQLIEKFPDLDIEHTLITGRCLRHEIDYLDGHYLNGKVIYIDSLKRSLLPIGDVISFFKILKLIFALKPDIVHTHTSKAGFIGRLATKIASPRTRIVHTFHGHLLYGYFSSTKIKVIIWVEKLLALISDRLIAVSHKTKKDLLQFGIGAEEKFLVIHPGLIPKTLDRKEILRGKFGVSSDDLLVAWVGRFTDIKNPFLALSAFEKLTASSNSNIKLIMAGGGELLNECRAFANSRKLRIDFLGWTDSVESLLGAANILLMTSRNEGMPVVIVEAALHGTMTLSSKVGGVEDFIQDGITGEFVEANSDAIAKALIELERNRNRVKTLGANAYKLGVSEFSLEQTLSNHVNLYKELARVK